ncbi:hypothetical protein NDU88_003138 [Pleurodeles waltl]|uniref:Uncharacterized protein n=1 Tax=Pleurodeles waltl TaxID=8319 RepID=A0AAV7SFA6_PLEWA|nr:hypothetical protein NDU88_003138 [Pleurodeles waltl]
MFSILECLALMFKYILKLPSLNAASLQIWRRAGLTYGVTGTARVQKCSMFSRGQARIYGSVWLPIGVTEDSGWWCHLVVSPIRPLGPWQLFSCTRWLSGFHGQLAVLRHSVTIMDRFNKHS